MASSYLKFKTFVDGEERTVLISGTGSFSFLTGLGVQQQLAVNGVPFGDINMAIMHKGESVAHG